MFIAMLGGVTLAVVLEEFVVLEPPNDGNVLIVMFIEPARVTSGVVPCGPIPSTAIIMLVTGVVPFKIMFLSSSPTGANNDELPAS